MHLEGCKRGDPLSATMPVNSSSEGKRKGALCTRYLVGLKVTQMSASWATVGSSCLISLARQR